MDHLSFPFDLIKEGSPSGGADLQGLPTLHQLARSKGAKEE